MSKTKYIGQFYGVLSFLTWMLFVGVNLSVLGIEQTEGMIQFPDFFPKLILAAIIVFTYQFFRVQIDHTDISNIVDLIWRVFVTGLVTTIITLVGKLVFVDSNIEVFTANPYLYTILFDIHLGLGMLFLISSFHVWRKLILYQKTKILVRAWKGYEIALAFSLILFFTNVRPLSGIYNYVLGALVIYSAILSANLKWVAYLNFKQKWKSILLLALSCIYFWYFFVSTISYSNGQNLMVNITENVTLPAMYAFNFTYGVFAILVILFNLPTSSVFEQKFEEIIGFQRLSQSRSTDLDASQIYKILLESSAGTVLASAAWIEIFGDEQRESKNYYYQISAKKAKDIKVHITDAKIQKIVGAEPIRSKKVNRYLANLRHQEYKSAMVYPVFVQDNHAGTLYLLKDFSDGFSKEMIEIIRTFVSQASISIENYQLLSEALENERYKEELKIAKKVQDSLLPEILENNVDFEITAFSRPAAEVGGDYYDTCRISDEKVAVIIGDVSGKGTSAAFHMSQMKGIFQSLAPLDLPSDQFICRANQAISMCLDRASLITASFFKIDSKNKSIEYTRAGHCPLLYYNAETKYIDYIYEKSLGLGIVRDSNFSNFISKTSFCYHKGDILLLFTDGITEAKNEMGEEYGYDRLKEQLIKYIGLGVLDIQQNLVDDIYNFCGSKTPDDDFTLAIIKFV